MESLQDLVLRRAKELGGREGMLSTRQLEDRAGGQPTRGVFQTIMAGTYKARAGVATVEGIAKALEVPVSVVEAAAGAPPSFGPFQLPDDAARLTPSQRKAVKHVVEVMLESNEPAAAEAPPLRLAARKGTPRKLRQDPHAE